MFEKFVKEVKNMDMKGKLGYLVAVALAAGLTLGVGSLMLGGQGGGAQTAEASATLTLNPVSHHSTEIRGVYVVASGDSTAALSDNLENDVNNLVVASFTSSGGSASVDWGTEYQLVIYAYGQENEVSNDVANIRMGIDGAYWGDSSGSVTFPTDNCSAEEQLVVGDDGYQPADNIFLTGGDNHIAVNYLGNSGGFTLARDETASIDNLLLQAYY